MVLAILQARMSSSRLPGKVLKPILGQPMLLRQIERVLRSEKIDCLVIATSTDSTDNEIEAICRDNNLKCFRGSLNDVLDRFYRAAKSFSHENVVRLTGDCPLIDPDVIDSVIELHMEKNYDYTSNCITRTFPDGLDVEVFKYDCLKEAWEKASLPSQREHVTLFIRDHPERFRIGNLKNDIDLSDLRWTVDEELDFVFAEKIYEALYPDNPEFDTRDVLELLSQKPELQKVNSMYNCNEGLKKSLLKDGFFRRKKSKEH